jgi:phage tail P2-like protein
MSDFQTLAPINDINLKTFDEILAERLSQIALDVLITSIVDNLPTDALPHLAEQYHITGNEGWLQAETEIEKRNLIKKAIEIHRYRGTKHSLLKVLETFDVDGEIKEWFEYDGDPFHFKVRLNVFSRPINETTENKLISLINDYKNVRSHLEGIEVVLASKFKQKIASAVLIGEIVIIPFKENENV